MTVNSPVMATVGSSEWFSASDSREVAMVIPADGPTKVLVVKDRLVLGQILKHTVLRNSTLGAVQVDLGLLKELILRELSCHDGLGE